MPLVKVDRWIFQMPDFIQDYSEDSEHHTYSGSLIRHITIEKPLLKLRHLMIDNDAIIPFYNFFDAILDLLFGLNCNFLSHDIALYIVWSLRGCKPIKVWDSR